MIISICKKSIKSEVDLIFICNLQARFSLLMYLTILKWFWKRPARHSTKPPKKNKTFFGTQQASKLLLAEVCLTLHKTKKKQKPQKHFLELSGPRNWLWQRPARNYTKPKKQKTQKPKKNNFLELSRPRNGFWLRPSRHATKPKKQKTKKPIFQNLVGFEIGFG